MSAAADEEEHKPGEENWKRPTSCVKCQKRMNREVCKSAICYHCEQKDLDNEDFADHEEMRDVCVDCDSTLCHGRNEIRTPYCGYCMFYRIKDLEARLAAMEKKLAPTPKPKWYVRTIGSTEEKKELSNYVSSNLEMDYSRTRPPARYSMSRLFGLQSESYKVDFVTGSVRRIDKDGEEVQTDYIVERV